MTFPCSIKIFENAFRSSYCIDQLKSILAENVEMVVTGTHFQDRKTTPAHVIGLFQRVVKPADTYLKGCLFSATQRADLKWVIVIGLSRNQNEAVNNCMIQAVCTLWSDQISHIEMHVESSTSKTLDHIKKFLEIEKKAM